MIIHLYRVGETRDQHEGWEGIDETGKYRGINQYLGQWRTIFETTLHRGPHPDSGCHPPDCFDMPAYWLEVKEGSKP